MWRHQDTYDRYTYGTKLLQYLHIDNNGMSLVHVFKWCRYSKINSSVCLVWIDIIIYNIYNFTHFFIHYKNIRLFITLPTIVTIRYVLQSVQQKSYQSLWVSPSFLITKNSKMSLPIKTPRSLSLFKQPAFSWWAWKWARGRKKTVYAPCSVFWQWIVFIMQSSWCNNNFNFR